MTNTVKISYERKLPKANVIREEIPLSKEDIELKELKDKEIRDVFDGKSDKFLIIIGPCSADNEEAVLEYIKRLAALQEAVKDKIILIPRIYTNKPRTTGKGYKGMLHHPNPKEKPDIIGGIKAIRKLHIKVFSKFKLPIADEMLYPENYPFVRDVLSYVAVGARSVENQQHRLTCSGVSAPVGMKNPTGGDFNVMLNAVEAAQDPHTFSYRGWEVKTTGNPHAHCILRGAVDYDGNSISNYDSKNIRAVIKRYKKHELKNPAIIIDTNHANSCKDYSKQPRIAIEIMKSRQADEEIRKYVKGLMIESYIEEGGQKIGEEVFGKSITDPCLGWEDSEKLVKEIFKYV